MDAQPIDTFRKIHPKKPRVVKLVCPKCQMRHVDPTRSAPHTLHRCGSCHHAWKPFTYATLGADDMTLLSRLWRSELLLEPTRTQIRTTSRSLHAQTIATELVTYLIGSWMAMSIIWVSLTIILPGYVLSQKLKRQFTKYLAV